ncbi:EF-hand calcium-binding domain-containing protein 2 [Heterocephalus glaber]|uniref:EF-hand calcium-binding domain-containing protein 2 n=1 Tax=Heterocephalus glaber TaxID=10181 RepID=G5AXX7_HETGA|nr:EF-hand calcium-binding domain-containing protein 2 [Heterocephalus glaber]
MRFAAKHVQRGGGSSNLADARAAAPCQAPAQLSKYRGSRLFTNRSSQDGFTEIGTIVRSLGCCPSEGELHDLLAETLDSAKRGFLTKEELIKHMTEEGEPFSQEEMEEMLSAAIDPESYLIHYKDYIATMVIDEN